MENKRASLLVVELGKTLSGIPPPPRDEPVGGNFYSSSLQRVNRNLVIGRINMQLNTKYKLAKKVFVELKLTKLMLATKTDVHLLLKQSVFVKPNSDKP